MRSDGEASGKPRAVSPLPVASSHGDGFLKWTVLASIMATVIMSYRWLTSSQPISVTILPESYAICAEPGHIYTVNETKSSVECILVKNDEIIAIGSIGL